MKALEYFYELSQIPRGSGNEKGISDYIKKHALDKGYEVIQDEVNNIIIYVPATPGYESHPSVILQGHMDMVCDLEPGYQHDFLKDPLDLYEEEGYLHASHTTLGADDGVSIAMVFDLLDSNTNHPALEIIFTIEEETTMKGALSIDPTLLRSHRFISLDEDLLDKTTIGSAGGESIHIHHHYNRQRVQNGYQLKITGLQGGHSGDAINKERYNATKLLVTILKKLDIQLSSLIGGLKTNAIPLEATATFSFTTGNIKDIDTYMSTLINAYKESEPNISYEVKEVKDILVYSKEETQSILDYLYILPEGVQMYSHEFHHFPELSLNTGIVVIDEDIDIDITMRSSKMYLLKELEEKIKVISSHYPFSLETRNYYPMWENEPSTLRETLIKTYKEYFGKDIKLELTHGGLETGVFKSKIPDVEIITLGPDIYDLHTYNERLGIKSLEDCTNYLKYLLERL